MNLPNAITSGRILSTPFIATLPFIPSGWVRLGAFILYIAVAITDYYDGKLARARNLVTDLGKMLDPLADKLLLFATLIPMYMLMAPAGRGPFSNELHGAYKFVTPLGEVGLSWWIVAIVIGRELFMTIFRQYAARKGVVISAIGPAKWKTGFQCTWVGSAFFWFFAATLAAERGWKGSPWNAFANFNGIVGVVTMIGALFLTLYSLWLYMRRYGYVITR
ncbi:MAG: CDP-alcohol phosphatidyltransferase family protein [Gemmatimonadaceae bacterium]|nr:CDP-alcohol phosphatidyltransferase family protein [Gemmatimonadaceae bacterium]